MKDGKRNGYLCIFIFFMGKIVFEFLIYWIIDEIMKWNWEFKRGEHAQGVTVEDECG